MAANDQGTGQHKHKSSEEPYPHHEAPTTSGQGSHSGQHTSGRDTRSEEKGSSSREERGSSKHETGTSHSSSSQSSKGSNEGDLRSREYTGPHGEEHHHTKTYEEQHKGESGSERSGKKSAA